MLHWAWGASVLVWTRSRINFIYLFELDPRGQVTANGYFQFNSLNEFNQKVYNNGDAVSWLTLQ
jgi:hypothetical protein